MKIVNKIIALSFLFGAYSFASEETVDFSWIEKDIEKLLKDDDENKENINCLNISSTQNNDTTKPKKRKKIIIQMPVFDTCWPEIKENLHEILRNHTEGVDSVTYIAIKKLIRENKLKIRNLSTEKLKEFLNILNRYEIEQHVIHCVKNRLNEC